MSIAATELSVLHYRSFDDRKIELDLPKIPKAQTQPKGVDSVLGATHAVPSRY